MRKDLFNGYCEWLFNILLASEKKIDFSGYDKQETRTLAYMAERLLSIYLIKLVKDNPQLKVKNLKMTFVKYTESEVYDKIDYLEKNEAKIQEKPYVQCVERAYNEMKNIYLPYDLSSLFDPVDDEVSQALSNNNIVFYGGGNWCKQILYYFDRLGIRYPGQIWDVNADDGDVLDGIPIVRPQFDGISPEDCRYWIITLRNKELSREVEEKFRLNGVRNIITNRRLVAWMNRRLWSYDNYLIQ
jgi:hypothetical protein